MKFPHLDALIFDTGLQKYPAMYIALVSVNNQTKLIVTDSLQNGRCGRTAIRKEKMDSLF